ncbi:MAG: DUF1549 domain-containing protein, partial [Planctomycetaceae bacterium]|nr:DUF1549 domain-containing protein [Planctomycetaceae bacterium]
MRALQSCWIGCLMVWAALAAGAVGVAQEAPPRNALAPEKLEFFETKVRPILVQRCYECHSGQESNGGLRLDYREGLLKGGDSGPALQADEPQGSLLLCAIRYQNADLQMPPSGKLDASEIEVLETWVAQGAVDPRADLPSGSSDKPQGMSIQDGRNFWSMMPLKPVEVPRAVDADWCRNPIDAFVLKELDSNGLRPSPESSRREILRRVTLGLIGLVPESQEYKAFEQDTAPEAYERQVDRLLSSEQYGVRFGRHWLDVARYSDSNGLDENIAYGNAWRYRDYVVEAFNSDKPFDRFIEEQIAGDLLPDADRQSKTATGFLVLGAKVLAEPDRDKLTMDTIDEQLDTIGKAFMGMTLGCARCHDHKFDPIKQRDYYALAAILKGTKTFGDSNFGAIKHWNEISYANPQEKEQLKAIDAQIAEKNGAWNKLKSEAIGKLREQVRKQAADYLAVASKLTSEATLNEWAQVGEELKLHPRVLANSRRYLDNHRQEPLFAKWHELAGHGDHQAIRDYYQELFERALGEWEKAKAADAQVKKLEDSTLEAARVALGDVGGFLA